MKNPSVEEATALVQYATPAQSRALLAYIAADGNATRAAAALKVDRTTIRDALSSARKRAAARGYAPEFGWNPPAARTEPANTLPEGQRVKGVSDKVNAAGDRIEAWVKSERASDNEAHAAVPPTFAVSKIAQFTDSQGEIRARWTTFKPELTEQHAALEAELRESLRSYVVPVEPVEPPEYFDEDTCGVIPIGDTHIGMLAHEGECGESSDLKIQKRDLLSAMDRLVAGMAPSKVCTIVPLGDNYHADDDNQRTPRGGHKLDVDGRSDKVARVGVDVFRRVIDRALQRFERVNVEVVGGNHDVVTSLWLRIALGLVYEKEPRVWVNPSPSALRVWEFGRCLFAAAHGDGITPEQMLPVVSARYREMWGRALHVYGYQGHRHKKGVVERPGGLVEIFRTMTGQDSFAAKFGHESGRDLVGITCHKLFGEIERKTVGKLLARAHADMLEAA